MTLLHPELRATPAQPLRRPLLVDVLICLLVVAAAAHIALVDDHLRWWWPSAVAFAAMATVQATLAWRMWRRPLNGAWLQLGIWSNAAMVALYVSSRLVGLPFVPPLSLHGGRVVPGQSFIIREPIGGFDLAVALAEIAVVVGLIALLPAHRQRWTTNALVAAAALPWAIAATVAVP